jgi:hypothetical protein
MAGQDPLESVIGELCKRRAECARGVPARISECNQILLPHAPGERVTSEEYAIVQQVHDAAACMAGHRNRKEARYDRTRGLAFYEIARIRGRVPIFVMNPNPRAKVLGIFLGVCNATK